MFFAGTGWPRASAGRAALISVVLACAAAGARPQPSDPGRMAGAAASTYRGWQVYQTRCAVCHGPEATGAGNAPNLLRAIAEMNPTGFKAAVLSRHPRGLRSGEIAPEGSAERKAWLAELQQRAEGKRTMPDWSGDADVKAAVLDVYGYLRARAEGSLDARPVRPGDGAASRR